MSIRGNSGAPPDLTNLVYEVVGVFPTMVATRTTATAVLVAGLKADPAGVRRPSDSCRPIAGGSQEWMTSRCRNISRRIRAEEAEMPPAEACAPIGDAELYVFIPCPPGNPLRAEVLRLARRAEAASGNGLDAERAAWRSGMERVSETEAGAGFGDRPAAPIRPDQSCDLGAVQYIC
jgi:hypothetical protein